MESAIVPDYTVGSKKSEQARVWIRSWLEGITHDPDKRILTIEQTPVEFKSGTGDEVNIHYFAREATSSGPGGGNLKVTVTWKVTRSSPGRRKLRARAASPPCTRSCPTARPCS